MSAVAAPPLRPRLTVINGGLDQAVRDRRIQVDLENAWVEVQAVAHDGEAFADQVLDRSRRIQVAIAAGRSGMAGQYAHELELAAPLHGHRASRSASEAQAALDELLPQPEPVS